MNIMLVGDLHCQIGAINDWVEKVEKNSDLAVDLVLQVGDFGFYGIGGWPQYALGKETFLKPTIVIPGNHENRNWHAQAQTLSDFGALDNFYLMRDGELLERNGVTIMGIGSAECIDNPPEIDRMPWDPNVFTDTLANWNQVERPKVDILITHDCPASVGMPGNPWIHKKYNLPADKIIGVPQLDTLWQEVRPKIHVSGHHHKWHECNVNDLRHLTLPMGHAGFALLNTDNWQYVKVGGV